MHIVSNIYNIMLYCYKPTTRNPIVCGFEVEKADFILPIHLKKECSFFMDKNQPADIQYLCIYGGIT